MTVDSIAKWDRRLLMFAAVSPILLAVLAVKLDAGTVWPWVAILPIAISAWVVRGARNRNDPHLLRWIALASLPAGFWLLALVLSTLFPQ